MPWCDLLTLLLQFAIHSTHATKQFDTINEDGNVGGRQLIRCIRLTVWDPQLSRT
eukprot:SAG31_NODE_25703_length_456_cov_0.815126_2_plen_54_part_01